MSDISAINLQPRKQVTGRIGMCRRKGALVSRVHGLQHVQGLATSHFAHDDAVGPHPERVTNERAHGHFTGALHVRGTSFERNHARLGESELGCIFDGDEALVQGDE
jgi:hypothetical protein